MASRSKLDQLSQIFTRLFLQSENTRLEGGANEPFYQAATADQPAIIYFREDYFSSVLHEIAHWCIAGRERRKLDDFGYWYHPEGRSVAEQAEFERVEVKPQALEWILADACRHRFHLSADNLSQAIFASARFAQAVTQQRIDYLEKPGMPRRAHLLYRELTRAFAADTPLEFNDV